MFKKLLSFIILFVVSEASAGLIRPGDVNKPLIHPLFGDNAIIQAGVKAPVWGWTTPGSKVTLALKNSKEKVIAKGSSTADSNGRWEVVLGPLKVSDKCTLSVSGAATAESENILIGDVWLCSGQSNMEWTLGSLKAGKKDVPKANHPMIRMFNVNKQVAVESIDMYRKGKWLICTPRNAKYFSAVGYYFGRELHKTLDRPVGLLNVNWGGTRIEAWSNIETLKNLSFKNTLMSERKSAVAAVMNPKYQQEYYAEIEKWFSENDKGTSGNYQAGKLDESSWQKVELPSKSVKANRGVFWVRRNFILPENWKGKDVEFLLGFSGIDDWYFVYVNGKQIGSYLKRGTNNVFKAPASLLKLGENTISVRYKRHRGRTLYGKKRNIWARANGVPNIPLDGEWLFNQTVAQKEYKSKPPVDQRPNQNTPGVLYDAMISPLLSLSLKGCIWYQGEHNAAPGKGVLYQEMLENMITDWRKSFSREMPFGVVQLPNFNPISKNPVQDKGWGGSWVDIRQSQAGAAKNLNNVGCITTIDLGEEKDIHPQRKLEVGQRLAGWALNKVYGKKKEFSGPAFHSMKIKGDKAIISFKHIGGGLISKDGEDLKWFAIAGADKKYVFAKAKIVGKTVVVSSPEVKKPVSVRYAWVQNPGTVNFYNKAGLPAMPFKTDK